MSKDEASVWRIFFLCTAAAFVAFIVSVSSCEAQKSVAYYKAREAEANARGKQ